MRPATSGPTTTSPGASRRSDGVELLVGEAVVDGGEGQAGQGRAEQRDRERLRVHVDEPHVRPPGREHPAVAPAPQELGCAEAAGPRADHDAVGGAFGDHLEQHGDVHRVPVSPSSATASRP